MLVEDSELSEEDYPQGFAIGKADDEPKLNGNAEADENGEPPAKKIRTE